ncbi:hypothetical protein VNO77_19409 [Canavalia gladiata]|uniref:Uncharacterized protein n=1 Tax=Canavalia gladiata TaxID=3824 RepID=A0AAN9QPK7_CANGL
MLESVRKHDSAMGSTILALPGSLTFLLNNTLLCQELYEIPECEPYSVHQTADTRMDRKIKMCKVSLWFIRLHLIHKPPNLFASCAFPDSLSRFIGILLGTWFLAVNTPRKTWVNRIHIEVHYAFASCHVYLIESFDLNTESRGKVLASKRYGSPTLTPVRTCKCQALMTVGIGLLKLKGSSLPVASTQQFQFRKSFIRIRDVEQCLNLTNTLKGLFSDKRISHLSLDCFIPIDHSLVYAKDPLVPIPGLFGGASPDPIKAQFALKSPGKAELK